MLIKATILKTRTAAKTANNYSDMGTLHTFISATIFTKKPLRYWIRENKVSALTEFIF